MQVEDKSTQCPNCQKPLTWLSHSTRWEEIPIYEFDFSCGSCNRRFQFKDNQLTEKRPQRNLTVEETAVNHVKLEHAAGRRCPQCGGPIMNGSGLLILRCEWCHQEYSEREGELLLRSIDQTEPRPSMSQFYAIHNQR
jgi:endogenous inhibitor of DNA gyrase (YacG/DUF329 family)